MKHRIAYILGRFPHGSPSIANELRMLSDAGVDVQIIALRAARETDFARIPLRMNHKVTYVFDSEKDPAFSNFFRDNLNFFLKYPLAYAAAAIRSLRWCGSNFKLACSFGKVLETIRPTLVYVNWSWAMGGSVMYACRILKLPFVFSVRGTDITPPARNFSLRVASAERIITPSNGYARILENKLKVPCNKIKVVPNCVDFDGFTDVKPARSKIVEPVRLLSIGTLRPVKRHQDIIRCCSMLRENGVACECRIFGDGPNKDQLQNLIDELRLNECVLLAGYVDRKELARELEWCDVYVHASQRESFCHAVVEAQASGRPVIAADAIGGIRQSVNPGTSAIIVPAEQPKEMFKAILELTRNPVKRLEMGRAGRKYVIKKFSYKQVAPVFLNALIDK